ncbi:MAG TPA: exodeoxyribonuclease VII large subunit [Candidatus Saccharibacteria bacterium]|nr:exodeoxyribonuclease VII large subunit [Candidatus Saccharibacteria bacterium]
MENLQLSVSDFVALTNQTLEYAYPTVVIEGEVASFTINQGKFVFFDLKDDGASVGCFMMAFALRVPIENGMKVVITASPKLTQWGKFSLTVKSIRPSGEGALKKSFELLKAKLDKEGLFAPERKRLLPERPVYVAVISSTQAAGYADFIKIINDRWGGMQVDVAHVQVQGETAPDQMIRALQYFNNQEMLPEVIVIIRGGGSADDLAAFNDEQLVRTIAASRVPTLVGVGHEVDTTLADMVADVRAATPSNAAQILVPDKAEIIRAVKVKAGGASTQLINRINDRLQYTNEQLRMMFDRFDHRLGESETTLRQLQRILMQVDPRTVLKRGYAIIHGQPEIGSSITVETIQAIIKAKVTEYKAYDEK